MSSRRTVGVLTFHRCINYGSYWQARCLVEGLIARGQAAVLLDHNSQRINKAEWRCALKPARPDGASRASFRVYAEKARKTLSALDALPRSPGFDLDRPQDCQQCDIVIVGSDEVWNLQHPWYGGRTIFYGAGLKAGRLAAYAASFGSHDARNGLGGAWVERLRRFSRISVRDENSRELIRGALGADPELVLDPCLQFPSQVPSSNGSAASSYVAVYGHSFPVWFKQLVRDWAVRRGHRVVSIGYYNDWADEQHVGAGPEGFAQWIAGAEAVATNFFHGCIFALLFSKPFVCASSAYRFHKVRGLARAVGIENRLADEATPARAYDDALGTPLEAAIAGRLAELRRRSDRYLDHVLE